MRDDRDQGVVSSLLMFILVVMLVMAVTACSTVVPVAAKFPGPPDKMGGVAMTACPQLKELQADPKLSDISKTITVNYGTYYECAVKLDTWIEWYATQKQIYEKAGK